VVDAARPGVLLATPLFLALVMVEFTDLVFAVDSIPAIFAITADPFLVFTSNVFAILGLRSLYFALAGMIDQFRYLKVAFAVVLMVVGVKMMTHARLKALLGPHFNLYLLGLVLLILAAGAAASLHREPVDVLRDRTCRLAPGPFRVRIRAEVLTRSRRWVQPGSQAKEAQT
jgi:tellurite resistance protein TerC